MNSPDNEKNKESEKVKNSLAISDDEEDSFLLSRSTDRKLRDFTFTDLFLSEMGESFLCGTESNSPVSNLPSSCAKDFDKLHKIVCSRGQIEDEFFIDYDEARYRVAKMYGQEGTWYVLRRALYPIPRLGHLGIPSPVVRYLGSLGSQKGLVLISGATGNGKTTTAVSLLQEYLMVYGGVAITVEDPPEAPLDGSHGDAGRCFQVKLGEGGFADAMKKTMRYHPRYIFLGEIRDSETASQAFRAAINGHLIITTIHSGGVIESLTSMLKLVSKELSSEDFARQIIGDGLAGVIHQKLVKTKGTKKMSLQTECLFPGSNKGIRAKIRDGKLGQLNTEIEVQKKFIEDGKSPTS